MSGGSDGEAGEQSDRGSGSDRDDDHGDGDKEDSDSDGYGEEGLSWEAVMRSMQVRLFPKPPLYIHPGTTRHPGSSVLLLLKRCTHIDPHVPMSTCTHARVRTRTHSTCTHTSLLLASSSSSSLIIGVNSIN
jgi:hypothetical protein